MMNTIIIGILLVVGLLALRSSVKRFTRKCCGCGCSGSVPKKREIS